MFRDETQERKRSQALFLIGKILQHKCQAKQVLLQYNGGTQYALGGYCPLSHARYTLEIAPKVTRYVKKQKHFKGYWVPHFTKIAPAFKWLATLTFVDGLVNPTSHARYTLKIASEVTRYVVGFTSPSTKVRVANHWSTCNLVTINLMPPKAFGGLKIIRGGSVPRIFPRHYPRGGPCIFIYMLL